MPPKRKAAAATKAGGKKIKEEPDAPEDAFKSAREALKSAPKKKCKSKVDENCHLSWDSTSEIYNDCDCMLNQTNIGHNNNKFYVIQVIKKGNQYYCWNRWGRVGEVGQSKLSCAYSSPDKALSEFEKKFKDKTKNDWKKKDNFVCHPGKYALIEVDGESEAEVKVDTVDGLKKVLPSKLDTPTKELIELIFSTDMFKEAMEVMNLDIKKMPLGKLSKVQIAKGFEVLEEMEEALKKKNKKALLEQLSSKFYTTIPHNFGRNRPPVIADMSTIEKKKEMLLVLADIELAQSLKAETEKTKEDMIEEIPHPTDQDYLSLNCELTLMDKSSKEYEIIENYLNATAGNWRRPTILNVWVVNRDKEAERYEEHDALENRRLLWHGTNIAVVAAILKSGLRIMPHSGGRVGKGIYFASENGKSAGYVGTTSKSIGIMLLNEVSLGKEYTITKDDCSLKKPPEGYDSVVARGNTEPDPSMDTFITLDGKKVTVPQGKPISQSLFSDSYFSQSEYLIYKESQCRIRYLLELKF
ncbi:PARP3 polymerase, partial [Atractosteus spatula]|nr:PARP3 polymerase [Atractosteus spatula]